MPIVLKLNYLIIIPVFLLFATKQNFSQQWQQVGADIDGENQNDHSGTVAISGDGLTVAIGAYDNDDNGNDDSDDDDDTGDNDDTDDNDDDVDDDNDDNQGNDDDGDKEEDDWFAEWKRFELENRQVAAFFEDDLEEFSNCREVSRAARNVVLLLLPKK